jgi:hypothetical protein
MKNTGWCREKFAKSLKNSLTKFDQYIVLSSHFSFLHAAIGGSALHSINRISFLKMCGSPWVRKAKETHVMKVQR